MSLHTEEDVAWTKRDAVIKQERAEWASLDKKAAEKRTAEQAARRAAGMGFWRLVWIVTLGILLAQMVTGFAQLFISYVQADPRLM